MTILAAPILLDLVLFLDLAKRAGHAQVRSGFSETGNRPEKSFSGKPTSQALSGPR
jgi:hypothetical protein